MNIEKELELIKTTDLLSNVEKEIFVKEFTFLEKKYKESKEKNNYEEMSMYYCLYTDVKYSLERTLTVYSRCKGK